MNKVRMRALQTLPASHERDMAVARGAEYDATEQMARDDERDGRGERVKTPAPKAAAK